MGPITLFDKSFLQQLSTDESVWFDNFFSPVISPLFYLETLADLQKQPRAGKTAEEEVGIIAIKTPQMSGTPCHFHYELCVQNLLGNPVPLNGRIPIAGARRVIRKGKVGAVVEETPEAKAFSRWQQERFLDVERMHARAWRAQLARIDLSKIEHSMKNSGINSKTCKSLEAALKIADDAIIGLTKSPGRFDAMLEVLETPPERRHEIKHRWKNRKQPQLEIFAPYAAHVLRVEIFFHVALGANLIASTRASHRVDMAYLFYVPFCTLFVSNDRLHRQCAQLFMRPNQEFVWGQDLKLDLAALNTHFAALPAETKAQGIFKFANRIPPESIGLIRKLFERHTPWLLQPRAALDRSELAAASHEKILKLAKEWESSPDVPDELLKAPLAGC